MQFPDKWHKRYVVLLRYTRFTSRSKRRIDGFIPVLNTTICFTHTRIYVWGHCTALGDAILVTEDFVHQNPTVMELIADTKNSRVLAKRYEQGLGKEV